MAKINIVSNTSVDIDLDYDISAEDWYDNASQNEIEEMENLIMDVPKDEYGLEGIKKALEELWLSQSYVDKHFIDDILSIVNKLKLKTGE